MNVPENLFYTKDHEWIQIDDNIAIIGITDYAQSELGDIIFLEFPEIGFECSQGDVIGTIEAVKTVADLYSPISGKIKEVNLKLEEKPEFININPYNSGWIIKLQFASIDMSNLLSSQEYIDLIS